MVTKRSWDGAPVMSCIRSEEMQSGRGEESEAPSSWRELQRVGISGFATT